MEEDKELQSMWTWIKSGGDYPAIRKPSQYWADEREEMAPRKKRDPSDPMGAIDVLEDKIKELAYLRQQLAHFMSSLQIMSDPMTKLTLTSKLGQTNLDLISDREMGDEVYQLLQKILHKRIEEIYAKIREIGGSL